MSNPSDHTPPTIPEAAKPSLGLWAVCRAGQADGRTAVAVVVVLESSEGGAIVASRAKVRDAMPGVWCWAEPEAFRIHDDLIITAARALGMVDEEEQRAQIGKLQDSHLKDLGREMQRRADAEEDR